MIKVAIFGAGKFGQYIKEILEKKVEVKCFIDNNKSIQNTKICGYEVVSVENFVENYANIVDNVLIAMAHPRATYQVISQLRTNHINHIYYVSKEVLDFKLDIMGNDGKFNNYGIELDKYNNIIPQLETHIIDSCNLNCKGCTHFSNLFDKMDRARRNSRPKGEMAMTYKTVVIDYAPKAKIMASEVEDKANEMAQDGWELVTFSITNSAKGILVFRKPNDLPTA